MAEVTTYCQRHLEVHGVVVDGKTIGKVAKYYETAGWTPFDAGGNMLAAGLHEDFESAVAYVVEAHEGGGA